MKNEQSVIQMDYNVFLLIETGITIRFVTSADNKDLVCAYVNDGSGNITNSDSLYTLYSYLRRNSINPYKETI